MAKKKHKPRHSNHWESALFPECASGERREALLALAVPFDGRAVGDGDIVLTRPIGRLLLATRRQAALQRLRDEIQRGREAEAEMLIGRLDGHERARAVRAWAEAQWPYPSAGVLADRVRKERIQIRQQRRVAELMDRAGVPGRDRVTVGRRVRADTTLASTRKIARQVADERALTDAVQHLGLDRLGGRMFVTVLVAPVPDAQEVLLRVPVSLPAPLPDSERLLSALTAARDEACERDAGQARRRCQEQVARLARRLDGHLDRDMVAGAARSAATSMVRDEAVDVEGFVRRFRERLADGLLASSAETLLASAPDGWRLKRESDVLHGDSLVALTVRDLPLIVRGERHVVRLPISLPLKDATLRRLLDGCLPDVRAEVWEETIARGDRCLVELRAAWETAARTIARLDPEQIDAAEILGKAERLFAPLAETPVWAWSDDARRAVRAFTRYADGMKRVVQRRRAFVMLGEREHIDRYPDLFPAARQISRRLVAHIGPTNSGKTHAALDVLAAARNGSYLAPLRLLALEGRDALVARGIACSLITGEEREASALDTHVSSTVEMVDLEQPVDVTVIDEAQMLTDQDRGWAWTQALVGAPATEVRVVGSPAALEPLRRIAALLNEPLEVIRHERLAPLRCGRVREQITGVPPRTAVIAFSRRDVLGLRRELARAGRSVSVIYGALSPEVRREQARRFREGRSEVLVATDAIGMGLNLPVREVLLTVGAKFDGTSRRPLAGSELRQVAGRAGRYGIDHEGIVSATSQQLLRAVDDALRGADESGAHRLPVLPRHASLEAIAEALRTDSIAETLRFFADRLVSSDHRLFIAARMDDLLDAAGIVDAFTLPIRVKHDLITCPVDLTRDGTRDTFRSWVRCVYRGTVCPVPAMPRLVAPEKASDRQLRDAEDTLALTRGYRWLALRQAQVFTRAQEAERCALELSEFIDAALQHAPLARRCRDCGCELPAPHRFAICDRCHADRRWEHSDEWDEVGLDGAHELVPAGRSR